MTRDIKLALILGFAVVLFVGLLISDHVATERRAPAGDPASSLASSLSSSLPSSVGVGGSAGGEGRPATASLMIAGDPPAAPVAEVEVDRSEPMGRTSRIKELALQGLDQVGELINGDHLQAAAAVDRVESADDVVVEEDEGGVPVLEMPDPRVTASSVDEAVAHVVERGDTLWGLAERYYGDGGRHGDISAFNAERLGPGGALVRGSVILIPRAKGMRGGGAAERRGVDRGEAERAGAARTYTVRRGDVLGTIAQRELGTATRWREILELNRDRIESPEALWVGLELKLPAR